MEESNRAGACFPSRETRADDVLSRSGRERYIINCEIGRDYYPKGESDMADKGSKDTGKREERKKPKHTLKEKRKLKNEKQKTVTTI
jgi:hypothetical protein